MASEWTILDYPSIRFSSRMIYTKGASILQDWAVSTEAEGIYWSAQASPAALALSEDAHSAEDLRGCETGKAWSERT